MQTFTFNELDERGQDNAVLNYFTELKGVSTLANSMRLAKWIEMVLAQSWRFNEHGERIA